MALKFCSLAFQHASWLSTNRLADPTVGNSSDGYLLSALTSGFHANFDSSVYEYGIINTETAGGAGEIAIPGMTANGSVQVAIMEDPGTGLTFSHAVCAAGKITIYVKDTDSAVAPGGAAAAIADGISVVITVLTLDSALYGSALSLIPVRGMISSGPCMVKGGVNQNLSVHAAANAAANIYAATAGFTSSCFHMHCADTNNAASNLGLYQGDIFCIPAATSFIYSFDIESWSNRDLVATSGLAQIGVMAAAHADFRDDISAGPQAASASAIYVEFAANTMKLVFGTTSSAAVAIPSTYTKFSVRIEYRAGKGAFLYLNNRMVAYITVTTATTAMQVFCRGGHLVAYTAATESPLTISVDAISLCIDKS